MRQRIHAPTSLVCEIGPLDPCCSSPGEVAARGSQQRFHSRPGCPTVRHLSLEMTDRLAHRHQRNYRRTASPAGGGSGHRPGRVYQTITDQSRRPRMAGQGSAQLAAELRPIIAGIIGSLDGWLSPKTRGAQPPRRATRRSK
jgi:hypothetical protein